MSVRIFLLAVMTCFLCSAVYLFPRLMRIHTLPSHRLPPPPLQSDFEGINRNIQDSLLQSAYNVPPIKCLPKGQCQPTRHIMFLKVHKCGSTTG
ncbi:uncharacterized protein LOC106156276 isoform X2 [Lingula anatina]|uniref:Uncharacterized protein LOC106156276 isoform X2 n=1 Tax=Lingula anatina TaxID=7574 RepID=A0A1S3HLE5_LINAN|nr:uncharacterized protein LOC106156276 isoform X2 [Lingula anatina]|eukprot:XP_013386923.1 uncharacterized protein LOC106156276 isoform X2 [Lingula anatina]